MTAIMQNNATVSNVKELILKALNSVKRTGMTELINWLMSSTFFVEPASTKYHGNFDGGLALHSYYVYEEFVKLTGRDDDSAKLACILHDVCKIGSYQKTDTGYTYKPSQFPFGHGDKSVYLISKFIELTEEEALMIRWHMGAYESKECWNDLGRAQELYPSVLYIHFADMVASKIRHC